MIKNCHILFIGDCALGRKTTNGVSAKNYFLLKRLRSLCPDVINIDTARWRKRPFVLLKLLICLITYRNHDLIISLNTHSAYLFLKTIKILFPHKKVSYFVIGGVLGHWLKEGKVQKAPYHIVKNFIVETKDMEKDLKEMGFVSVISLPNFKDIPQPLPERHRNKGHMRFIFLSRIIPEKGCGEILEAIKILNEKGLRDNFCVHFYGKIDSRYQARFETEIKRLPNAFYLGFLDLQESKNYDTLAGYDLMLFPTFWPGEGFPGVIIDAFIAGLPVIATKWAHNEEIIKDGITGTLIPVHDTAALTDCMHMAILNPEKIKTMSRLCQQEAVKYDTANVLNENTMKRILSD